VNSDNIIALVGIVVTLPLIGWYCLLRVRDKMPITELHYIELVMRSGVSLHVAYVESEVRDSVFRTLTKAMTEDIIYTFNAPEWASIRLADVSAITKNAQ